VPKTTQHKALSAVSQSQPKGGRRRGGSWGRQEQRGGHCSCSSSSSSSSSRQRRLPASILESLSQVDHVQQC